MTETPTLHDETPPAAGFLRRLGAMFYDSLLLLALMLVATALLTLPLGMPNGNGLIFFQFFIFEIIPLAFFTQFWRRGGQTLGMRAWKLRVIRDDGEGLTWGDALRRHFAALLSCLACGLGFVWILVDPQGLAWHDRLSKTRLIKME
jgi:uncharacterized RDD family membrane protein YckC